MRRDPPWRILYVIWALDLGGAEQIVIHLARGLDRGRFHPMVGCLTTKGRFAPVLESAGVPVVCLDKQPKVDLGLVPRLRELIRRESIDLVHAHLFTANLWGRLAGWQTRTPVVVTEHSVDTWKGRGYQLLDWLLKPLTTHWIFVSPQVRTFYERRLGPIPNGSVIINGVPVAAVSGTHRATTLWSPEPSASGPATGGSPCGISSRGSREPRRVAGATSQRAVVPPPLAGATLATVGRLAPEKAQARFIELLGALHREGLPVRGLIIGDGPERAALERAVTAQRLTEIVEFTGLVTDMAAYWPRIDCFCLTSSREGLPLAALEAMARGIPVLSTAVGGVPECVTDGVEGFLVPFGEWTGFLTRARQLVQDAGLRQRLGAAGRARVERQFSVTQMVRAHERLYEQILKGQP